MSETGDTPHRLVTHRRLLKPAKPPRSKLVVVPEIEVEAPEAEGTTAAAFLVYQSTAADVNKHTKNLRDPDTDWQSSILSIAVRDNYNHPLWKTAKDAAEQLGQYPQSAITTLLKAYDEINGPQDSETVEGNSERTPAGSSPSDSPENADTTQPTSS